MNLTRAVSDAVNDIAKNPSLNSGIEAMQNRAGEFEDSLTPKLVGTYIDPEARAVFDERLDETWSKTGIPSSAAEIIIGGGLHAAIYCAVRVREGAPKPLVIEANERVGGAFAVSSRPTFYLNSTNRPGDLGTPGRSEALNYLPGAVVQPSDLGGEEYQTNAALAFAIRTTLAASAKVLPGQRVREATADGVILENGRRIQATRVIYATGLGQPKAPPEVDGGHFRNYMQFIAGLDQPFPLRGLKRVAVVGAGDSGKTAIEALTGQGPPMPYSVSALDWPEMIDWYGVNPNCAGRDLWAAGNRSRYKGISRVLPQNGKGGRVNPITRKAENVGVGYNGAYVDGARYDLVIWCGGFEQPPLPEGQAYKVGGREVARMMQSNVLAVGPAANLELGFDANVNGNGNAEIPENTAAVFRYADRTAALAMALPKLELAESRQRQIAPAPAFTNREITEPVPDKNDWRNLEPGDQLAYGGGGSATVLRLEDDSVIITNEIERDGSVSFPFPQSRALPPTVIGRGANWTYTGPGEVPAVGAVDKSDPGNWRPGDRIRYGDAPKTAEVAEVTVDGTRVRVTITDEQDDNGYVELERPNTRPITPEFWKYEG